jgi:hypothetical protein
MSDGQPERASRQRRRRLIRSIRLPHISGKASALGLVICFALTAVFVPMAVRLPLWVDFEFVVAAWWLIWAGVLARLLYLGRYVTDDHHFGEPRRWFGSFAEDWSISSVLQSVSRGFLGGFDGCLFALFLIFAFAALLWAAWFVVEIAAPLVAFLLYFLIRAMLAQVLNDNHGCRGRIAAAVGRGVLWATLYTAPLAGVVWLVHRLHG